MEERKDNYKLLFRLTWRSLCASKIRNCMAVIAIALTTILMTSLFTMFFGITENMQINLIQATGSSAHVSLKRITDQQYDVLKKDNAIKQVGYSKTLCDKINNEVFLKRRAEFWYYDDATLDMSYIELSGGHRAKEANEIMADTITLKLLGIEPKEGADLTLRLVVHGVEAERKFVLAGWWEANKLQPVSLILSSSKYLDVYSEELSNETPYDLQQTGMGYAYIKFNTSAGLESKLLKMLHHNGFTNKLEENNRYQYIETGVNWAYLSSELELNFPIVIMLVAVIALIGCAGYLIIYNIFLISISRDIHIYGLLKAVGATADQCGRIVWRQVFLLSLAGLPLGLLLGFSIGTYIIPYIMGLAAMGEGSISLSVHPLVFLLSALFSFFTVCISAQKSAKIVARLSPIEAVRFQGTESRGRKNQKRTKHGAKIYRMAFSNLARNKKSTVMVLLGLSLASVLFAVVFLLSASFDMDEFIKKFSLTDFEVSHVNLKNSRYFGKESEVSGDAVKDIQSQPWYLDGGRVCLETNNTEPSNILEPYIELKIKDLIFSPHIYGLDPYVFNKLELIEGSIDLDGLESGASILLGVGLDDNGRPEMEDVFYQVGDTVHLNIKNKDKDVYEEWPVKISGFVKHHQNLHCGHSYAKTDEETGTTYWNPSFFIPMSAYNRLYPEQSVMSLLFEVKPGREKDTEKFLLQYTKINEPFLTYHSRELYLQEFFQLKMILLLIGGSFSIMIGIIGIINFVNTFSTSLLARRREFAMLESIGMTKRQLNHMLCYEGIYYAVGASFLSLCIGVAAVQVIVKPLCDSIWFLSYSYTLWPFLISFPIFILLGAGLSKLLYYLTNQESIMVRIRKTE